MGRERPDSVLWPPEANTSFALSGLSASTPSLGGNECALISQRARAGGGHPPHQAKLIKEAENW